MPSLFVFRGNNQGMRFELEADLLTIGRDAANAVQLQDTEVSRRHAEVRRTGSTFSITDLASSNGTYVNGQQVTVRELANGDEVQLGGTLMLYTCLVDESTGDLADKIDIIARQQPGDQSRIVRSISEEEGSRILEASAENLGSPWLARARSNLQVMYRTALAVSHTLDIDQLLNRIMQLIFEWVEADRGCIMLIHPDTGELEPAVRRNRKGIKSDERIKISQTILDYVMEHNEGVLTSDACGDDRWNPAASILQMGVCEAICVPMRGRYNLVGLIYIDTSVSPQRIIQRQGATKFNDEHLKLMIAIAHQAALAVEDTRYYSAMVQAERLAAVGQTIATLSHHIKNILQGIRGGSFLIKEGLSQHDENMVRKGWEFVEKNQDRISNLVMDMLTFSKEREPELVPADMNEVAADVVELMSSRAKEKNVGLSFIPAAKLPTLVFDPEGLHRAILNVVTNALDACDRAAIEAVASDETLVSDSESGAEIRQARAGRVELRVEYDRERRQVQIRVSDNGQGIPADEIDQVFSLFVSKKGNRGTGLGLPVSQKIIKEHGGRIVVNSQVGEGSEFILELPAVFPEQASTGTSVEGKSASGVV
ncbi:MAG TPA: ATP-binding protein [Pirellulales bacterium]|nr:ATP-binding protein [Pirellulales bacterium]